ncbi:putative membrane protein [Alkalibacillus flavidus]|uniref:Membrane protein n=1 Tax=Alkalibacillus flavidus TaxID=546021 RepID=A0ABV2KT10_9BACI
MMNGQMGGNFFGSFMFGSIMIIIIVLIVLIFLWMFKSSNENQTTQNKDSLDVLKTRLAKGEITEEEYERLKKKIES